ncbi:MAG: hypothetical protein DHS80DRAFT_28545 [Piptocephalis tieghemiana]|nr:MAG: hypothetical protein DHS80DRAFT_28545 [Piptocephalis tieghemiana]
MSSFFLLVADNQPGHTLRTAQVLAFTMKLLLSTLAVATVLVMSLAIVAAQDRSDIREQMQAKEAPPSDAGDFGASADNKHLH